MESKLVSFQEKLERSKENFKVGSNLIIEYISLKERNVYIYSETFSPPMNNETVH